MQQCDGIDGVMDGVIEDPDLCQFRPETMLCSPGMTRNCLTGAQADTVRKIFSPVYGKSGNLLYPRMQPGNEITSSIMYYSGEPINYAQEWFRYAIYNNPKWDARKVTTDDFEFAQKEDPANVSTWKSDLSAFHKMGRKLISYHGLADSWVASENSNRYYNLVSRTMNQPTAALDAWFRHFRISGMDHCTIGPGANQIGQADSPPEVKADPNRNVIRSLVRWVEEGVPPEYIMGTKYDTVKEGKNTKKVMVYMRRHCKYPLRNVYNGYGNSNDPDSWDCKLPVQAPSNSTVAAVQHNCAASNKPRDLLPVSPVS
jgi:feruloyl esterase